KTKKERINKIKRLLDFIRVVKAGVILSMVPKGTHKKTKRKPAFTSRARIVAWVSWILSLKRVSL
ncbi:hypothetical protein, partial [Acinetobacter baumannii]|uniref:hypothetical protein n=1 Tax=Acinetobacter baumannii TaxID=470 RepID=UPI00313DEDBC